MAVVRALFASTSQGRIHLRHRRFLVPRHHAWRCDADHRDGRHERFSQGIAGTRFSASTGIFGCKPLESPLTDWKDVAERIQPGRGIRLAAPVVDGMGLANSPFNASGVLIRGIRADDLNNLPRSPRTLSKARSRDSTKGRALRSAAPDLPINCHCTPETASHWSRRRGR